MILAVIALYLALVILVGVAGHRFLRGTGEDYFVASRTIGPFVLLMTLFGTNMTSFALLGVSGEAYHRGIGIFSLMGSSTALVVPTLFFFLGTRVWRLGKEHGFVTQVQFFRARWGSSRVGLLLFAALLSLTVPYLLIGVLGGGITLSQITGGQIPQWLGSLVICGVVLFYVTYGGVRSTSWANTFQTLVFMSLGAATFFLVVRGSGGLEAALGRVAPELRMHGDAVRPLELLSYTCIPMSVGMFPHIFMHWLTARRAATFRLSIVAYPLCVAAVVGPSTLLGVLGSTDVPGLAGPEANGVLIRMIGLHAPEVLAGLLAAGVLAAMMSSLDSQVLALSSLFTEDVVRHYGFHDRMGEGQQILVGRLFVGVILGVAFLLSLFSNPSIFRLSVVWCFTGFASLLPLVVAALYWRRSSAAGAAACIWTALAATAWFFWRSWDDPGYSVAGSGLMPVALILLLSTGALVAGSLLGPAPAPGLVDRFFAPSREIRP